MSEEKRKLSAFEAFQQTQMTYAEAEEKAKQEAGAPKVSRYRIGEDGEYPIRVLPLAPSFDSEGNMLPMERKGYEYPVHQFFLGIKVPSKKGKTKKISIPIIRTTDKEVGKSVDLLDTYIKIAKEMYGDDKELIDLITNSSYQGGLRWNYLHAIMVLDLSSEKERAKGPQLWQATHSQYKDMDAAKMRLWAELRADGSQDTCPISGLAGAYPVKVIRSTDKKTEYTIEIGRKTADIKEEEFEKLLELPRIPEQIYRYTRYQLEATVVFLQQYDEEHSMEVCKEPDFIEAVETLKGELSPEDTSHFDINGAATKGSDKEEVTIDSLWDEYDNIVDQDLGEKSDEYQELREKIRQFIETQGLDVRISRTKNNQQILNEIDEALDAQANAPKPQKEEPAPAPTSTRRAPKPKAGEPEDDDADDGEGEDPAPEEEAPAKPVRARRARPGSEEAEAPEEKPEPEADDSENNEEETADATSSRRRRNRRLR